MDTIYIHRRFQENKNFVDKKQKKTVEKINKTDTHTQCSSMRNTPSHVRQTKRVCSVKKNEQEYYTPHTTIEQRKGVGYRKTRKTNDNEQRDMHVVNKR